MGLNVLLHAELAEVRHGVLSALDRSARVERVETVSDTAALATALQSGHFDAVFVDLEGKAAELLELLENLGEPRPALLLGGPREDAQLLVRAMRLRPETFVVDRAYGELDAVLDRIVRERPVRSGAKGVIGVAGTKGGVGTTLVACELAASLARLGDRVAIVDLCPQSGDVALHLDLLPTFSLADVARKGDSLDDEFLRTVVVRDPAGVGVLASPPHFEDASLLCPRQLERSIRLLRLEFDWVVLDLPRDWNDVALKGIDLADLILLVATPEVPALTHARQRRQLLLGLGAPLERVRTLLNRATGGALDASDCARALGFEPDATLPNDSRSALPSVNEGRRVHEIDGGGRLDQGFQQLAASIYEWLDLGPVEIEPRRSLVARLGERWMGRRVTEKGVPDGTAQ